MKERGRIIPTADTEAISIAVLAAIQGGIPLSKTARNSKPLELAFHISLGRIPSMAAWVRAIRPEPWMGRSGAKLDRST